MSPRVREKSCHPHDPFVPATHFCGLHAVRDALNKTRKQDRGLSPGHEGCELGRKRGGKGSAWKITRALGNSLFLGCRSSEDQDPYAFGIPALYAKE